MNQSRKDTRIFSRVCSAGFDVLPGDTFHGWRGVNLQFGLSRSRRPDRFIYDGSECTTVKCEAQTSCSLVQFVTLEWHVANINMTYCMLFHQTYPHSHPRGRSSSLEEYSVRFGRKTDRLDRAGLEERGEKKRGHLIQSHLHKSMLDGTTTLMFTKSPKCQCLAGADALSLNHTAEHSRSGRCRKCAPAAAAWWVVSHMLVVKHMTAHKSCLADAGYARQSSGVGTFIICWLMLTDWSAEDKKLSRGPTENGETMWNARSVPDRAAALRYHNSLIL